MSPVLLQAERVLRRAWRAAEASLRAGGVGATRARDAAVLAHVKRRAAACQRRLGRLRDAARSFRELAREPALGPHAPQPHENLLEVLLEQRAYPDAQAQLARLEEQGAAPGAAFAYTRALLRARAASAAATAACAPALEQAADEALRDAFLCNPHVPDYLLELRALALPPEHVLRGGCSEALAYSFFHLRHWRACPGALRLLEMAWSERGPGARGAPRSACAACADRELLAGSAAPLRRVPALLPLAALLCVGAALAALSAHRWPALARVASTRLALMAQASVADPQQDS